MKRANGQTVRPSNLKGCDGEPACVAGRPNKRPTTRSPRAPLHLLQKTLSITDYHAASLSTITPETSFALRTSDVSAFTTGRSLLYPTFTGMVTSGMGGCAGHPELATTGVRSRPLPTAKRALLGSGGELNGTLSKASPGDGRSHTTACSFRRPKALPRWWRLKASRPLSGFR